MSNKLLLVIQYQIKYLSNVGYSVTWVVQFTLQNKTNNHADLLKFIYQTPSFVFQLLNHLAVFDF